MTDTAKRLRSARLKAGYENTADAARAMGVREPTYRAHENATRGFTATSARRYARFFGVSVEWLLYGPGQRNLSELNKLVNRLPDDKIKLATDFIKMLLPDYEPDER